MKLQLQLGSVVIAACMVLACSGGLQTPRGDGLAGRGGVAGTSDAAADGLRAEQAVLGVGYSRSVSSVC
jgi:hypothetical protein